MIAMKTAIHLHTNYSHDSNRSPEALVRAAAREGIDCLAITDHDEIDGALAARDLGLMRVIVGQEVSTRDGHLIGLFLHRRISPGLSAEQTIDNIHDQGGLALAPHPYCTLCDSSLGAALPRIVDRLDAIEIHNAQNPLPWQDARARAFAAANGLVEYVGADAHLAGFRTPAYQLMREFAGPRDFLRALADAQLVAGRFGLGYYALMGLRHVWDKCMPKHLYGFGRNSRTRSAASPVRAKRPSTPQPEPSFVRARR